MRKRADALAPTRSGTRSVTLGTKDPSGRGGNSNSGTGSKSGKTMADDKMMVETESNNMEQGTGRRRVVQERGGEMGGAR